MKKLFLFLLLITAWPSLQGQGIGDLEILPMCWSYSGTDSTLYAYWQLTSRDDEPKVVSYLNSTGGKVDISAGGTLVPGYCGQLTTSTVLIDVDIQQDSILVLIYANQDTVLRDTIGPFSGGTSFTVIASNGLNDQDVSSDIDVELGGTLERTTVVDGAASTYPLSFYNMQAFRVSSHTGQDSSIVYVLPQDIILQARQDTNLQRLDLGVSGGNPGRVALRNVSGDREAGVRSDRPGQISMSSSDNSDGYNVGFVASLENGTAKIELQTNNTNTSLVDPGMVPIAQDSTGWVEFGFPQWVGNPLGLSIFVDTTNNRIRIGQFGATYDLPYRDPDAAGLPPGEYLATFTELGARGGVEGWLNTNDISGTGDSVTYRRITQDSSVDLSYNEKVTINYSLPFLEATSIPARGAYSIRRLSYNYTGPAFTVENRAGDTLQVNYLAGIGSVYDTVSVLAFGDTVYVKRWYDQSGLGNNLEVTVYASGGGKGPYLVRSGVLQKDNEGELACRFINTDLYALETLTNPWGEPHNAYSYAMRFNSTGTNFGPISSRVGATNEGLSMYYTGGDLRLSGNGYQVNNGGPYAVGTVANVAPDNTPNNLFVALSASTASAWNDGAEVTSSSELGEVTASFRDSSLVVGANRNGSTNFWYYDGYLSELIIWGVDASIDESIVSSALVDYYDDGNDLAGSSNSITLTLPIPSASNLNRTIDVIHNGDQGQETIIKTETGSGYFIYNEQTLDSLLLSSTGNPSIQLQVTQAFDDSYYYQMVSSTEIDQRLIDTIDTRLDPQFIYVSQYTTLGEAVSAAKNERKTLVIDALRSQSGVLDLDSLSVFVAAGGFLNVDTLTANEATLYSPGPMHWIDKTTIVTGNWHTIGNSYLEWTNIAFTDTLSNWIALKNAVVMGDVRLLDREYRIHRSGNNDLLDVPISIKGQGKGTSILVLTNQGSHFTSSTTGSPVDISDLSIHTLNFENGTYNNNTEYTFSESLRSSTLENVVTDMPYFRLNNVEIKGEVRFDYGMSGTETTKPDSITFVNSGIKSVEITNSYFEGVRDVFSLNNTFARTTAIEHNEVHNLFGVFYFQGNTLSDSLDAPYQISDVHFDYNKVINDSTITYTGGAYLSPLVVKARNVYFNNNRIEGLSKRNAGADVHVCYPSTTGSYWATNNSIKNVWEAGEGSAFKLKGAVEAHINNNRFEIERQVLFDEGFLDVSGELIDSSSYAFAIVDKEDQSLYLKMLEMRDNTIKVAVLNKATTVRDVSSFRLVNNDFYIGRVEAEPAAGWTGNSITNTIFYSSQNSALRDTISSFVAKGNNWVIGSVENSYVNFIQYADADNGTDRLTPLALFSDTWNVDSVTINYMSPYAKNYINDSQIIGKGFIKNFQGGGLSGSKGYSFENGVIDLVIDESVYFEGTSEAVFPLVPKLKGSITVHDSQSDTLLLLSGQQNDWNTGWLEDDEPLFVQVRAAYIDTIGESRIQVWKLNYTTNSFVINHYQDGSQISYNPQVVSDSLIESSAPGFALESVGPGGARFQLRLSGLNLADNYKVEISVSSNDFSSIKPNYSYSQSGSESIATDGTGDITITHGLGFTPTNILVTPLGTGASPLLPQVLSNAINSSTFTVRWFDTSGSAVTSTTVDFHWSAE